MILNVSGVCLLVTVEPDSTPSVVATSGVVSYPVMASSTIVYTISSPSAYLSKSSNVTVSSSVAVKVFFVSTPFAYKWNVAPFPRFPS